MLMTAEKRLAAGDPKGAQELAQQALDKRLEIKGGRCSSWRKWLLPTRIGKGRREISRRRFRRQKIPRWSAGRMSIWDGFWT